MPKRVHGGRKLLNLPGYHSTAAIVAEVENTVGKTGRIWPSAFIAISDCDRKISLEFDVASDEDEQENNLYKVDTMIEALKTFRRGLIIEHERALKRRDD